MITALYIILMFSSQATSQERSPEVVVATVSYNLNYKEIFYLSNEAMAGSSDAALRLANFYWIMKKKNINKARYWAIIGAENGSSEAQLRAFQTMRSSTNILEQRRALFWLKKSAEQGDRIASAILSACPDVSSKTGPRAQPCYGPGSD